MSIEKNPELKKKEIKWKRVTTFIEDCEEDIRKDFCLRLPDEEPSDHLPRSFWYVRNFINPTQDLITAPVNQLFRKHPYETFDDTIKHERIEAIEAFSKKVNRGQEAISLKQYVKDYIGANLKGYGTVFLVIDKPRKVFGRWDEELKYGMPYLTLLDAENILGWKKEDGIFKMFTYKGMECGAWTDYTEPQPEAKEYVYIWTETMFYKKYDDKIVDQFNHNWGIVPVVVQAAFKSNEADVVGASTFEQTSRMLLTYNDNLHLANYEITKNGSGVELWSRESISSVNSDVDIEGKSIEKKQAKGKRLVYENDTKPEYFTKELSTESQMSVANYYLEMAVANERDQKSVSKKGATGEAIAESGFAKIIDRDPVVANLISLAIDLTVCMQKVMDVVAVIMRTKNNYIFQFDTEFDFRTFKQRFEDIKLAYEARANEASPKALQEMYKDSFKDVSNDPATIEQINKECDSYNPDEASEFIKSEVAKEFSVLDDKE